MPSNQPHHLLIPPKRALPLHRPILPRYPLQLLLALIPIRLQSLPGRRPPRRQQALVQPDVPVPDPLPVHLDLPPEMRLLLALRGRDVDIEHAVDRVGGPVAANAGVVRVDLDDDGEPGVGGLGLVEVDGGAEGGVVGFDLAAVGGGEGGDGVEAGDGVGDGGLVCFVNGAGVVVDCHCVPGDLRALVV